MIHFNYREKLVVPYRGAGKFHAPLGDVIISAEDVRVCQMFMWCGGFLTAVTCPTLFPPRAKTVVTRT